MDKKILTSENFKEQWRTSVPKIFGPELESLGYKACYFSVLRDWNLVFESLAKYIFDDQPKLALEQLRKVEYNPSVCCEILRTGTPTYRCLECTVDKTRVLCVHCFMRSAHRGHKYKIILFETELKHCECGHTEVWKSEPFCEKHLAGLNESESTDENFVESARERAETVFVAVLEFFFEMIFDDYEVQSNAEESTNSGVYCALLHYDDHHQSEVIDEFFSQTSNSSIYTAMKIFNIRLARVVIQTGSYTLCIQAKAEAESKYADCRYVKKVSVVPYDIVLQQIFAIRLLHWLRRFVYFTKCKEFRKILSKILLEVKVHEDSLAERFFKRVPELSEYSRRYWQQLFVSGMTIEYESKKALAEIFLTHYEEIAKNCSVRYTHGYAAQFFTSPELSYDLIEHNDALTTLLHFPITALNLDCQPEIATYDYSHYLFEPSADALKSAKLLLQTKPKTWTTELRKGFLKGVSKLLELVKSQSQYAMVDLMKSPWITSTASLMQPLISSLINKVVEWCGTDKVVFELVLKSVLENLYVCKDTLSEGHVEVRELVNHSANCIKHDVSSEPVSAFSPLSNFLAALFLLLEKHEMDFNQIFGLANKLTPVQIIEPVLRKRAMISQVQSDLYHEHADTFECTNQILIVDRDIALLQIGAILVESNEFMIHMLNKFKIMDWASRDYETKTLENSEQNAVNKTIGLVEEFLWLLIAIVGERYVLGVGQITQEDRLKKEIIQQLCASSQSCSMLEDSLFQIYDEETGVEFVIDDVAVFDDMGWCDPKLASYDEYNVFYYHYTREWMVKTESAQRDRLRAAGEPEHCPPPKLPRLTETFTPVVNLLQCGVTLHIMQTVLERTLDPEVRVFSQIQFHEILHLIGYALQEQESSYYPFLDFTGRASKFRIYELLQDAFSCSSVIEPHRSLLTWTLSKFKAVAGIPDTMEVTVVEEEPTVDLIVDKERIMAMAAERKEKILAEMMIMQKNFLDKNLEQFQEAISDLESADTTDVVNSEILELSSAAMKPEKSNKSCHSEKYTCFICHEDQSLTASGPPMVLVAFVTDAADPPNDSDSPPYFEPNIDFLISYSGTPVRIISCGHSMHFTCWLKYSTDVGIGCTKSFVCGVCERFSNTVIPLLPPLPWYQPTSLEKLSFQEWVIAWKHYLSHVESFDQQLAKHPAMQDSCNEENVNWRRKLCFAKEINVIPENSKYIISDQVKDMIRIFALDIGMKYPITGLQENQPIIPFLVLRSIASTIKAIEADRINVGTTLSGSLTLGQRETLKSLSRISTVLNMVFVNPAIDSVNGNTESVTMKLFSKLLTNSQDSDSVLYWHPFTMFITLVNSMCTFSEIQSNPCRIMTEGSNEAHILNLAVCFFTAMILLKNKYTESEIINTDCQSEEEDDASGCDSILRLARNLGIDVGNLTAAKLWRRVKRDQIHLLRCCALFFHFVTEIPFSIELSRENGDTSENICKYLGLTSGCDELLNSEVMMGLLSTWAKHPKIQKRLSIKTPLQLNKLVNLPEDYNEIIEAMSTFVCPTNGMRPFCTFKCLICGVMLCGEYCNGCASRFKMDAPTYHMKNCGVDCNIFLDMCHCDIRTRGKSRVIKDLKAPYIDRFGCQSYDWSYEPVYPVRLCMAKYEILNNYWILHQISVSEGEDEEFNIP